jgi:hypothetical protein
MLCNDIGTAGPTGISAHVGNWGLNGLVMRALSFVNPDALQPCAVASSEQSLRHGLG